MSSNSGPNIHKHSRTSSEASSTSSQSRSSAAEDDDNKPAVIKGNGTDSVKSEEAAQDQHTCGDGAKIIEEDAPAPNTLLNPTATTFTPGMVDLDNLQGIEYDMQFLVSNDEHKGSGGIVAANCFFTAAIEPPITPDSLTELDMPRIINNPRLRHDVNFDRELHFRPNLDGNKGKEKIKQADDYWKALQAEIHLYRCVNVESVQAMSSSIGLFWINVLNNCEKRLPLVFKAVRDILLTLVPDTDQKAVEDRLDVQLIMQEIKNGVCDLDDLANWLGKILKNHCAPMRDNAVDHMKETLKIGAADGNAEFLTRGIRLLVDILEAMKLDVANHQIKHMRPILIEDTINFQRRYNAHRIQMGKIDVQRSRLWFDYEMATLAAKDPAATHIEAITSYLLKGLLFNETELYPQTFYLDQDRLKTAATDLRAIVFQEVCRDVLIEFIPINTPKYEIYKAVCALSLSVRAIVGSLAKFHDNYQNIAAEIMRLVLMLEGRSYPSDLALLHFVENRLIEDLNFGSPTYDKCAQEVFDRVIAPLNANVEQYARLSALHLQDQLVPQVQLPLHPIGFGAVCEPPKARVLDLETDCIRRLTHMIVLHWKVWAELVYLPTADDDQDSSISSGCPTPPSSGSASPMIPVAQAVYAPGRKWLPIGITVKEVPSGEPTPLPSPQTDSAPPSVPTIRTSNTYTAPSSVTNKPGADVPGSNKPGSNESDKGDDAPEAPDATASEQSPEQQAA